MGKKLLLFLTGLTCSAFIYAQTLDEAILAAAIRISNELPANTTAAVIKFNSEYEQLNDYVVNELYGAILRNRRITPVKPDQNQVHNIPEFLNAESARSTGRQLGAQYLITGALEINGDDYRVIFNAIDINAEIRSQYSEKLIHQNDQVLARFLGYTPSSALAVTLASKQKQRRVSKQKQYREQIKDEYEKPVLFTLGLDVVPGYRYAYYSYNRYEEIEYLEENIYKNFNFGIYSYFKIDISSYVIINIEPNFYLNSNNYNGFYLDYSFLGKYPFYINQNNTIFPIIKYEKTLNLYNNSNYPFWYFSYPDEISLGIGMKIKIKDKIYLNPELTFSNSFQRYMGFQNLHAKILLGINYNITERLRISPELSYIYYLFYNSFGIDHYINILFGLYFDITKRLRLNMELSCPMGFKYQEYYYNYSNGTTTSYDYRNNKEFSPNIKIGISYHF